MLPHEKIVTIETPISVNVYKIRRQTKQDGQNRTFFEFVYQFVANRRVGILGKHITVGLVTKYGA